MKEPLHQSCLCRMIFLALFGPRISQSFRTTLGTSSIGQHLAARLTKSRHSPLFASFSSLSSNNLQTSNNPTTDWKGSSRSTSDLVTHVLIPFGDAENQTIGSAVEAVLCQKRQETDGNDDLLSARQLLEMGSVWFLPASAPKDPSLGTKPVRLEGHQYNQSLENGDYLRIHHHPRRFKTVHDYDWAKRINNDIAFSPRNNTLPSSSNKPGVIVEEDASKGWLVIDKPPGVPVHMTVDNRPENVQICIKTARQAQNAEEDVYVSTPQRLDQNTSGFLVVATSPAFAAYFAALLRNKTVLQLLDDNQVDEKEGNGVVGGVHKIYRCLVCIQPSLATMVDNDATSWSVGDSWADLKAWASNGTIIRHYLEPSIRAPKTYVKEPPVGADDRDAWLESLLRIKHVGPFFTLVGNEPSENLAKALWDPLGNNSTESKSTGPPPRMPKHCQAITEIRVELLTGRTHQIRGQLSAMGYPLVGDIQYGGAQVFEEGETVGGFAYERLALQCSELEFVDPDIFHGTDGSVKLRRSRRWNKFRLDRAWWTSSLEAYHVAAKKLDALAATTDAAGDVGLVAMATGGSGKAYYSSSANTQKPPRPDLLPDRVQLSPGKNKYVLVRASHRLEPDVVHWFVKSATPAECGGPYHGNVAQDLREWIKAAGYDVVVTGGGRIDFCPSENRCLAYGFSYGFGKGNHRLAAQIIQEETNGEISATFDYNEGLY